MRLRAWLSRAWDVREGEGRITVLAFSVLLLVISAHTVLETARDALLMTKIPPRSLGIVYIVVAALALPIARLTTASVRTLGARQTLAGTVFIAALSATGLFLLPTSRASVILIYVVSALLISVLIPLFWTLVARWFTVGQGRRLLGLIAAAGVLGGVMGSGGAALALLAISVKPLLLVSAATFAAAGAVLMWTPAAEGTAPETTAPADPPPDAPPPGPLFGDPYRTHVAILVALSTATVLATDYFFMWTVARHVESSQIGVFVARFYAGLNVASLVIQLFVGGAIVRRLGLARAIVITPLLVFCGALGTLAVAGAMLLVLVLKAVDGSLRYSIHRVTSELLYIPMPEEAREQAKPIIDGPLARASQAVTAAIFLALSEASLLSPRVFAGTVTGLAAAWLTAALTMRRSYLGMLRRVVSPDWTRGERLAPINLASAGMLVEYLSSDDPLEVLAAVDSLVRRGSLRLIPALILRHDDEAVLLRSLEIFGASSRTDWFSLGRRLLEHELESVRIAAARALAMHSQLDAARLAKDVGSRVQGYAALHLAAQGPQADLGSSRHLVALLRLPGSEGDEARLGLVAGIADSPPDRRLGRLLVELADRAKDCHTAPWSELLAVAAVSQREARMIPRLLARLPIRAGREAARAALVRFGDAAQNQAILLLHEVSAGRANRLHLPHTLARFGTRRASEVLLATIETEPDGFVRYKEIRALARIVSERRIKVDRVRVERLAFANLVEHVRLLSLRVALDEPAPGADDPPQLSPTGRLLGGLLEDKMHQALERTFLLLKTAHPREDVRRIHVASLSSDKVARANAGELLDTMLGGRDQDSLRNTLRIVMDDLDPKERVARAQALLTTPTPPNGGAGPVPPARGPARTHDEAVVVLLHDADVTLAAIAAHHAVTVRNDALAVAVAEARRERPEIEIGATRFSDRTAQAQPTAER